MNVIYDLVRLLFVGWIVFVIGGGCGFGEVICEEFV